MNYKQISEYQRAFIHVHYEHKYSMNWIANKLKIHRSSVSREIKRNSVDGKYEGLEAHELSKARRSNSKVKTHYKYNEFLEYLYSTFDKRRMSIDVIVAITKMENMFDNIPCTKTVYNWVNEGLLKLRKSKLLRYSNWMIKKDKTVFTKRNKEHRVPITLRRREINERKEYFHWEGDCLTSAQNNEVILNLTERKSRFMITKKIKSTHMENMYEEIKRIVLREPKLFKSITFDNGMEFNEVWKLKNELGVEVYYCHPYSPSERGTNEVANAFIRRYIPKGFDVKLVDDQHLKNITDLINKTPRRILGYKSAERVLGSVL